MHCTRTYVLISIMKYIIKLNVFVCFRMEQSREQSVDSSRDNSTDGTSNVKEIADDDEELDENIVASLPVRINLSRIKAIDKDESSDSTENPIQDIEKIPDNTVEPEKKNISVRRKLFPKDDILSKVTKEDFIPKFVKTPERKKNNSSPLESKLDLTDKFTLQSDSMKTNINSSIQKSDNNFAIFEDNIKLSDHETLPEQPSSSLKNYVPTKNKMDTHIQNSPVFDHKQYTRKWVDSVNEEYLSTYETSNYSDQEHQNEDDINNISKQQTGDNEEENNEMYDVTFLDCKIRKREENIQKAKGTIFGSRDVQQKYKKLEKTFHLYFGWHSSSEEQNEDIATVMEAEQAEKMRKKSFSVQDVDMETECTEDIAAASKKDNNKRRKGRKTSEYQAVADCSTNDPQKAKGDISPSTDSSSDSNIKHATKEKVPIYLGSNKEILLTPIETNATKDSNAGDKRALLDHSPEKQKVITEEDMQNLPGEIQGLLKKNVIISVKIKNLMKMGLSVIPIVSADKSLDNTNKNDDTSSNAKNSSVNMISYKQKLRKKLKREADRRYTRSTKKKATRKNDPKSDKSQSDNESDLDKQPSKISSNDGEKIDEHTSKRSKIRVRSIEELTNPSASLLASTSGTCCSIFSQASSGSNMNVASISSVNSASVENTSSNLNINISARAQSLMKDICKNFQYCRNFYQQKIDERERNKTFFKSLHLIKTDLITLKQLLCVPNILNYINEVMQLKEPISVEEYNTYVFWTKRLKRASNVQQSFSDPGPSSRSPNSCDSPLAKSHQNRVIHQRNINKPMYFKRIFN